MSTVLVDDIWKVILSLLDNTSIVTLKFVNVHLHSLINKAIPGLRYDLEDIVYCDQYSILEFYIRPLIGMPKYSELLVNRLSYLAGYCDPSKYMNKIGEVYFNPEICLLGIYMSGNVEFLEYFTKYEESRKQTPMEGSILYPELTHDNSMALRSRSIEFTKHLKYSFTPRCINITCGYGRTQFPYIEDIDKKFNIKPQTDICTYMSYLYTNYEASRKYISLTAIKYDYKLLTCIMKLGYELTSKYFHLACEYNNLEVVQYMCEHGLTTDLPIVTTSVPVYNYLKSQPSVNIKEKRCAKFAFMGENYEKFIRNQHSYGVQLKSSIFVSILENCRDRGKLLVEKAELLLELGYNFPSDIYLQLLKWLIPFSQQVINFVKLVISSNAPWNDYGFRVVTREYNEDLLKFAFEEHKLPVPVDIMDRCDRHYDGRMFVYFRGLGYK